MNRTDEVEQVRALGVVELQSSGDFLEDMVGGSAGVCDELGEQCLACRSDSSNHSRH